MYENAKFVVGYLGNNVAIKVDIDGSIGCVVPLDPANSDYANIMKLVEAGELTIAPADAE